MKYIEGRAWQSSSFLSSESSARGRSARCGSERDLQSLSATGLAWMSKSAQDRAVEARSSDRHECMQRSRLRALRYRLLPPVHPPAQSAPPVAKTYSRLSLGRRYRLSLRERSLHFERPAFSRQLRSLDSLSGLIGGSRSSSGAYQSVVDGRRRLQVLSRRRCDAPRARSALCDQQEAGAWREG